MVCCSLSHGGEKRETLDDERSIAECIFNFYACFAPWKSIEMSLGWASAVGESMLLNKFTAKPSFILASLKSARCDLPSTKRRLR